MSQKSARCSPLNPPAVPAIGSSSDWSRLAGSSRALALVQLAAQAERPLLVLTPDSLSAQRLADELRFYQGAAGDWPVLFFPDWETLPYDIFSPYQDIISERLATLVRLPDIERGILVAPVNTVMHRLPPREYLLAHSLDLQVGQQLDIDAFRRRLVDSGYRVVSQVMEHGDLAVRGSIIDLYPMGTREPLRIDLFDDQIDTIRVFDPESQRSQETVNEVRVLPAREVPLVDDAIARFRANWRARFAGNPSNCPIYRDVSQGLAPAGIEYYLPLFYEETQSLFDYMSDSAVLVEVDDVGEAASGFWDDIESRYESGRHDVERPLLPPETMFISPAQLEERAGLHSRIRIHTVGGPDAAQAFAATLPAKMPIDARASDPLALLRRFIDEFDGRLLLVAESGGRRETLLELLQQHRLKPALVDDWPAFLHADARLALTVAPLEQGAQLDDPRIAVIAESQLFGERAQQRRLRRRGKRDPDAIIRNLTELTEGAAVVHEEHGVGRYVGLERLTVNAIESEFITLSYAEGDKLYVPVTNLDQISRYTGTDPEHAPLHKLGSGQWEKARRKAAKRVHDVAAELLDLYARRAAREGVSQAIDDDAYQAFVQGFPFEETAGQQEAIDAVLGDMKSAKPMDRLICGDAGFGKTEVALRAAFIAVQNGYQVAILVPTTLLAQQHYQTFRDRFADWPVKVELLSRFRSAKEHTAALKGLKDGQVDIVIGTHKLLQSNVQYKRLGLVIIDEEHRFGVRQKEKIKALRSDVDILTLTATPIPRTLNLALSELRDLSIIATPPQKRLAVKTFVREWDDGLMREALLREIKRGGQVYFLHNKVETIEKTAEQIEALMPEARVQVAHGQMPEKQLEQVMLDFYHRRFNVLVCTTIIETGIDVPSANTIIINRADRFGLAQLYQLRGRVGRSHHRAYAYMIVPSRKAMSADAVKRLEAIESLEELGIGFTLATHDLEIRGAGEILGEDQSGQMHEIGFGLYMDMLERAVEALKAGKQPQLDRPLDTGTEINLTLPALLPEDYLPDVHARLILYKRIASAADIEELNDLREEVVDRFGPLPEPAANLFRQTQLKLKAKSLGVRKIDIGAQGGRIQFDQDNAVVDPQRLVQLLKQQPQMYRFDGPDKLRIMADTSEVDTRFKVLHDLLDELATRDAA
ncbi:transcription-repair coupling factor (superfamily II helicase) [Methylohalomonas lacus]|uniref:Transcription-repair-coupling factor n=1 Tax=Methylohalomonas lacus TaxID=398773 RepID=A0AAE3HJP1_9GAMM|nr:transcription-repair coupling factor [Methylohalomonas lacus]MCS3902294.1 transcription-repair coupling factor (superfamily II helicase) [Methylohalomonas lacus]